MERGCANRDCREDLSRYWVGRASSFVVLALVFLIFAGFGAAESSVTAHHPTEGESVEQDFNFTFTYTADTDADPAWCGAFDADTDVLITKNSSVVSGVETNMSASLALGTVMNYEIGCNATADGGFDEATGDPASAPECFEVGNPDPGCGGGDGGDGDGPEGDSGSSFSVFDNFLFQNTSSDYRVNGSLLNITFQGHGLNIFYAGGGGFNDNFNLTDPNGNEANRIDSWDGSEKMPTSGADTPGRYTLWNEDTNVSTRIDVVGTTSDIAGRITGKSKDITSPEIQLYYWMNGSEMPSSAYETSRAPLDGSTFNESLYWANISQDDYWIGFNDSGFGYTVKASRGTIYNNFQANEFRSPVPKPRINDVRLGNSSNISGQVTDMSGSPIQGLEVELTGWASLNTYPGRQPYTSVPPIKTDMTDSNGFYNFTGLSTGDYKIKVTNDTYFINGTEAFMLDASAVPSVPNGVRVTTPGSTTHNLLVTDHTANLSVNLTGRDTPNLQYGVAVFTSSGRYISEGFFEQAEPGVTNITVRNGTDYQVMAVKFDYTGSSASPTFQLEDTFIGAMGHRQETEVTTGFEPLYTVSGTVKNDNTGAAIPEARITLRNETNNQFVFGRSDSSGEYALRAPKMGYDVEANPPGSRQYNSLQKNETSVTVPADDISQNLTLGKGKRLTGQVTDGNGNRVQGFLNLYNRSEGSFSFGGTNETGHFNISGLSDIKYTILFEPRDPALPTTTDTVNLGQTSTKDITVSGRNTAMLNGTIKNATDHTLEASVRVRSGDGSISRRTATDANGSYSVTGLPQGVFYRVEAEAKTSGYSAGERSVFLTENTTQNVTLNRVQGITGYIKEESTGEPVEGVTVLAENVSRRSFDDDRTDSDGAYTLSLAQADHTVEVLPGGDSQFLENATNITETQVGNGAQVNITIEKGAFLSGEIQYKSSSSAFNGSISAWNESEQSFGFTAFENGTYNITGLDQVDHNIWINVENESFDPKRTTASIGSAAVTKNFNFGSISSRSGRKIGVIVQNTEGNREENATVYFKDEEKLTNSDGAVIFPRQNANEDITITAEKEDYAGANREITTMSKNTKMGVKDWQNVTLTINNTIDTQFTVTVNLTDPSGATVEGPSVVFMENTTTDHSDNSSVVRSGVIGGQTQLEGMVVGGYMVAVTFNDGKVATNTTVIRSGESGFLGITKPGKSNSHTLGYKAD